MLIAENLIARIADGINNGAEVNFNCDGVMLSEEHLKVVEQRLAMDSEHATDL